MGLSRLLHDDIRIDLPETILHGNRESLFGTTVLEGRPKRINPAYKDLLSSLWWIGLNMGFRQVLVQNR
jgi:hypothetical protein